MPRESPDARDDLSKQRPCQVALGQLQDEVPSVPDEAPAGLEESLLETRQRPALDGEGQHQPAQKIAEVIGDHSQEYPDLVGAKAMKGEARRVGGRFALLSSEGRRGVRALQV